MTPVSDIVGKLSPQMARMILRSQRDWPNEPPRCFGPGITRKALRERGLAHGDFCYLTPLGLQVRASLIAAKGEEG